MLSSNTIHYLEQATNVPSHCLQEAIDNINATGQNTYTAHALNHSAEEFMESDGFYQPNVAKILVLLTDGE